MKKHEKEILQNQLNSEKKALEELKKVYEKAAKDCADKIAALSARTDMENLQSIIYQKQYQQALKKQIEGILDVLQGDEFETISQYLQACYEDGFISTMYSLTQQGIPLVVPIDQSAVVKAIQTDSKISKGLYERLGEDVDGLKTNIRAEISRGISNGSTYNEIATKIAIGMSSPFKKAINNAIRITRTEGNRISNQSAMDAMYIAREKGADQVKQWCAALDSRTRSSHRRLDGQLREIDEEFSNGLQYPLDPKGKASEVVNCRCTILKRARWALGEEELNTLKERAEYYGLDKTEEFEEYKKKYLKAVESERVREDAQTTKIRNKNGEEIHFSESLQSNEKWQDSLDILKSFSNEYNTRLVEVRGYKKGENTKGVAGEVSPWGTMLLSSRKKSTAIHEFAHSMSISNAKKYGIEDDDAFWKEIKKVRAEYKKARRVDPRISISYYAEDSVDEFMAEAFAHAKMKQLGIDFPSEYGEDTTYSDKVLAIVDKYFKKEITKKTSKTVEYEGGIPKGWKTIDITKDDAVKNTNPKYGTGAEYSRNCPNCACAYEMRKRGYDVVARPYTKGGSHYLNSYPWEAWKNADVQTITNKKDLIAYTQKQGNGARFGMAIEYYNNSGHVIVGEVVDDVLKLYDVQTGKEIIDIDFSNINDVKLWKTNELNASDRGITACEGR